MSQQFYILKPAVGTEETGMTYPAVESFEDYDFNAPNSVHKIQFNEFPNFIPDIRFKLRVQSFVLLLAGMNVTK